jgi:hypothetical protein
MPDALCLGRIVWAEISDSRGNRKLRPAVIVTPTKDLKTGGTIDILAVTTQVPDPPQNEFVVLPWHPQGHVRTKLRRKCAVVTTWKATISVNDIHDTAGVLPTATIGRIVEMIRDNREP